MNRCPRCGADLDYGHDQQVCIDLGDSIDAAVDHAREVGMPTDPAAALTGSLSGCIPPGRVLTAVVIAAIDAWADAS